MCFTSNEVKHTLFEVGPMCFTSNEVKHIQRSPLHYCSTGNDGRICFSWDYASICVTSNKVTPSCNAKGDLYDSSCNGG